MPPAVPAAARIQGGVFTRAQAVAAGFTYYLIRARIRSGDWMLLPGGGISADPSQVDARAVAWSAHLSVPSAVLSHTTAGALRFPITLDTSVAHVITTSHQTPSGIIGHRQPVATAEFGRFAGLPVTGPAQTALDCLGLLPWEDCLRLWAWVVSRGVLTIEQLAEAVRERFGRRGNANLERLLRWGRDGALSEAERRLHRLLRSAGIAGWTANARIQNAAGRIIALADVLFEHQRLIIEVDGFSTHADRDSFIRDRHRQNALVAAGYTVFRVTWFDLTQRPAALVQEILALLGR